MGSSRKRKKKGIYLSRDKRSAYDHKKHKLEMNEKCKQHAYVFDKSTDTAPSLNQSSTSEYEYNEISDGGVEDEMEILMNIDGNVDESSIRCEEICSNELRNYANVDILKEKHSNLDGDTETLEKDTNKSMGERLYDSNESDNNENELEISDEEVSILRAWLDEKHGSLTLGQNFLKWGV